MAFEMTSPHVFLGYNTGFHGTLGRKAKGNLNNSRPWAGNDGWKRTTQGFNGLLAESSTITSVYHSVGRGHPNQLNHRLDKEEMFFSPRFKFN